MDKYEHKGSKRYVNRKIEGFIKKFMIGQIYVSYLNNFVSKTFKGCGFGCEDCMKQVPFYWQCPFCEAGGKSVEKIIYFIQL